MSEKGHEVNVQQTKTTHRILLSGKKQSRERRVVTLQPMRAPRYHACAFLKMSSQNVCHEHTERISRQISRTQCSYHTRMIQKSHTSAKTE